MTRAEILSLPAGCELDQLVAEKVMGQAWQGGNPIPGYDGRWPWPPPYSTDIAAAWELVPGKLPARWLLAYDGRWHIRETLCVTEHGEPERQGEKTYVGKILASGATAPEAICRAALLATLNP